MSYPSTPELPASLLSLPAELFFELLDYCDMKDLLNLWRCGGYLSQRLEDILFDTETRRQKMLYWACVEGDVDVLRRSVSLGTPPSVIRSQISTPSLSVYPGPGPIRQLMEKKDTNTNKCNISSLSLVESLGNLETFVALLELGADISLTKGPALRNLFRLFRLRDGWPFLRAILNAGHGPAILATDDGNHEEGKEQGLLLVPFVREKAPLDILEGLINAGASVNSVQPVTLGGKCRFISPLAAAIEADYIEAVSLLIDKGADTSDHSLACTAGSRLLHDIQREKMSIPTVITVLEHVS